MTMLRETAMSAIHREQWLPASLAAVFSFFSDAGNLDRITPPWLRFRILGQSELVLSAGTLIHYRLAWCGIPMKWTSRIEEWIPPTRFVDVQLKGPYRRRHHTHTFESRDGGTLLGDTVHYEVPMGAMGNLFAGWMVRRDVERIFDYRAKQISAIFFQPRSGYGNTQAL
jgi:ligand-binding SRPBCC domain-containing protein